MQVVVDGLLTNYKVEGTGKVILMLHGWGDSLGTFNIVTSSELKKYKIVRLDLPGFGGTQTPQEDYDLEQYSKFVANFLRKIEEEDIFSVIGHSNGGAIAIKAISNGYLKASNLILLASSGVRSKSNCRNKALRILAKTIKLPVKLLPADTQNKLKKHVYTKIGSDLFVAEKMQATFKNIITEDLMIQSENINIQTLLIYGDQDEVTPLEFGELFSQRIKKSKLEVVAGARHMLHQTHPHKVVRIISVFIESSV